VQSNPFNNLPKINKKEALGILRKPISEVKISTDYYKAVFHLGDFPCEETEEALLEFIKLNCDQLEFRIAKRKAIEILSIFDCQKAIPIISEFLNSNDPYLVETVIWSLGKLNCNDTDIINQICTILHTQFNNKRVVIQTLTNLGVKKEIEKIRSLSKDKNSSNGVKGACIAALIKLVGEEDKLSELKGFLRLSNQNDRHCAVQDIVSAGHLSMIPPLIKAPISPSFKIKAIDSLWNNQLVCFENVNLINSLDAVIIDDPNKINTLEIKDFKKDINSLIEQLFHTDFNRCYHSIKELQKYPSNEVLYNLNINWNKAKSDYGAIYFFMNMYKFLLEKGCYDKSILQKIEFLLGDEWTDYMKFKSTAIQILGYFTDIRFYDKFYKFSDESLTPFWKNRYTALLVCGHKKMENKKVFANLFSKDSHRFVRLKARQICF